MNTRDELAQVPPPPGCLDCPRLDSWKSLDGIRRRMCADGHHMHDPCGYKPRPPSAALDAAPWEKPR